MLLTCDNENDDLDDEDKQFLEEYSKRRMIEMQQKFSAKSAGVCFGKVAFNFFKVKSIEGVQHLKKINNGLYKKVNVLYYNILFIDWKS